MPARIGIFGGTFDPPHLGHLIVAAECLDQLALTRLLWMLTPDPPHKLEQTITPLEHRLAMTHLALSDSPGFTLSRVELNRPGPHYTLDTVRIVSTTHPGAEVGLLIGGDSLRDLPRWHRPAELIAACSFLGVMRRPGDAIDLSALKSSIPNIEEKVKFVEAPLLEISSREIRKRIAEGKTYRYYLPEKVYDYIEQHRLYR
jgi:nicotinate-nucleotide adenylyltransferase